MIRRYSAAAVLFILLLPGEARADSAGKLVSKGNRAYQKQQYDEAASLYGKASVKMPESGIIAFNLGDVLYQQEDYAGAREHFEDAAMKTRDLSLEARAWYNTGNCAFAQGSRQVDSDMEKALGFYEESVNFYATALEKDPSLTNAAHNMEIARLFIKDLLDRIQKQKEQMQQMQEQMKEIVDSLLVAIGRQEKAQERSLDLDDPARKAAPGWKESIDRLAGDQADIAGSTSDVSGRLGELFPSEIPEQVGQAIAHLDSAGVDQNNSVSDLASADPVSAAVDQGEALEQMNKALELLTQGEQDNKDQQGEDGEQQEKGQQDQQQDQQEQPPPEQQEQQARSETARSILEEEKENRKKRKQQAAGGYKKVEKDW